MAIVLPCLLLVVAGVVDLGNLFWEQQVLTNATREGPRRKDLKEKMWNRRPRMFF